MQAANRALEKARVEEKTKAEEAASAKPIHKKKEDNIKEEVRPQKNSDKDTPDARKKVTEQHEKKIKGTRK